MYVLSDGTETTSKRLYLQDAIKFAFSISSYSIPNSDLGVDITTSNLNSSYKLIFDNICKSIDPGLNVSSVVTQFDKIIVKINYPYGNLEVVI